MVDSAAKSQLTITRVKVAADGLPARDVADARDADVALELSGQLPAGGEQADAADARREDTEVALAEPGYGDLVAELAVGPENRDRAFGGDQMRDRFVGIDCGRWRLAGLRNLLARV